MSQNESRGVAYSQINMDLEPEERSTSEHTNRPPRADTSRKEEKERNTGYYNGALIFSGWYLREQEQETFQLLISVSFHRN